jgi:hypothetical protein
MFSALLPWYLPPKKNSGGVTIWQCESQNKKHCPETYSAASWIYFPARCFTVLLTASFINFVLFHLSNYTPPSPPPKKTHNHSRGFSRSFEGIIAGQRLLSGEWQSNQSFARVKISLEDHERFWGPDPILLRIYPDRWMKSHPVSFKCVTRNIFSFFWQ